jgi:hypothetical protein
MWLSTPSILPVFPRVQTRSAPGRLSSTTNDARVRTPAPGRFTVSTTRRSVYQRWRMTVQRV